jgi:hypothetical protein
MAESQVSVLPSRRRPAGLREWLLARVRRAALLQRRVVARGRRPTSLASTTSRATTTTDERVESAERGRQARPDDRQVDEEDGEAKQGQDHCGYFADRGMRCSAVVT